MAFPKFSAFSKSTFLAFSLALASSTFSATSFAASNGEKIKAPLQVTVDRAKVIRIAKAADTVIVGNPFIVDATIQDARTIVLTGRNFGVTNLIVLDSDGDPIVDETVVVRGHETNIVRIYRQSNRETLSCSPVCENTLTVGDNIIQFAATDKQIEQRYKRITESSE